MSPKSEIEKLALKVAQAANADGVLLENRIEALKVLNPYYAILAKNKGKLDDEPSEGPSFADFQGDLKTVESEPNGRTPPVRGRRGNGTALKPS